MFNLLEVEKMCLSIENLLQRQPLTRQGTLKQIVIIKTLFVKYNQCELKIVRITQRKQFKNTVVFNGSDTKNSISIETLLLKKCIPYKNLSRSCKMKRSRWSP